MVSGGLTRAVCARGEYNPPTRDKYNPTRGSLARR